jgi:hypothetical protein
MRMLLLSIPFSLLCFYLSFLTWRRGFHRHALVLALFGLFFSAAGIISVVISVLSYYSLRV